MSNSNGNIDNKIAYLNEIDSIWLGNHEPDIVIKLSRHSWEKDTVVRQVNN